MTPSIPLQAVTREVVDAIHTRATVLTGVIDTVINVCKGKTTKFIFLQNWTTNKRDTSNSLNYYNKKQANGLKKNVQFTKGEVQDLITVFSKLAEVEKDSSEQKGGSGESQQEVQRKRLNMRTLPDQHRSPALS